MKKIVICIVLLLSGLRLLAAGQEQEPYFCTRPGTQLYYERTKVGKTKLLQTTLFEIESARPSAKGRTIRYAVTLTKANGSELYGGRAVQTAYASPDGDITLNFGETVKAFIRNLFPRTRIEVSEASAVLPAQMQPGDTLPETHCSVKVMGITVHFDVKERKVLRRERIITPAGTFDCMVVREHKREDAPFHHVDEWVDNYYVQGLGYVRHDRYDKDFRLQDSEVLVRIDQPAQ